MNWPKPHLASLLAALLIMGIAPSLHGAGLGEPKTKEERNRAMDLVFQNLESLSLGVDTFTLEFGRSPSGIRELVETGHVAKHPIDPYSGDPAGEAKDWRRGRPGDLLLRLSPVDKESTEIGAFYALLEGRTKYLARRESNLTSKELRDWLFRDTLTEDERLVSIYGYQISLAQEPFAARHGSYPDRLAELTEKAHFNADFLNPFSGKRIRQTEEFSAGDLSFKKRMIIVELQPPAFRHSPDNLPKTDERWFFTLIGYGKDAPVYYYSNDPESIPPKDAAGNELLNPYSFTDAE